MGSGLQGFAVRRRGELAAQLLQVVPRPELRGGHGRRVARADLGKDGERVNKTLLDTIWSV